MNRIYSSVHRRIKLIIDRLHRQKKDIRIPLEKWDNVMYINKVLKDKKRFRFTITTDIDSIESITKKPYAQNADRLAVLVFNALSGSDVILTHSRATKLDIIKFCEDYKIPQKKVVL